MKPQAILKNALTLPPDERCRVADALYASVAPDDNGELSAELKSELDELIRQDKLRPEEGIAWEDLKRTLKPKKKRRTIS
jgi:putative addiction module component (TIGR02574 family)